MIWRKILRREEWIENEKNQRILAEIWGDYINWEKRRRGENGWLVNQLKKHNCRKVFDSALGDGCDSIYLTKEGFNVLSNDIDEAFIEKARENARREGISLKIYNSDWKKFAEELLEHPFDAVLCLGNSLSCVLEDKRRSEALHQFYSILKEDGILIIDERNYQPILDGRKKALEGEFYYSGNYMYCGEHVHSKPVEIAENSIKYEIYDEKSGKKAYWAVYPFKTGELKKLLKKAGFKKIEQYSDYKPGENKHADFYMYVCPR